VTSGQSLDDFLIETGRGDRGAFETVYDQTSAMVYGVALRILQSASLAEEVAQEVFLQVWKQADRFDPNRAPARAWIATLAHRRAVDAVRRTQSARDREQRLAGDQAIPDVSELAIENDESSRVSKALGRLSFLQREVIELAYFGGLTQVQMAERLGAPLGTIKTRMRDGLTRLRTIMSDEQ
jgi:RNA polymerase sigma-70 factor (ECF subfamily)